MITFLPDLENAMIIEVYIYYDRPLLFSCQDKIGQKFLAVLAEEIDEGELWLYVPVSPRRFEMVRSGGIDLYTAFSSSETGYAFTVTLKSGKNRPELQYIENAKIKADWLPVPGTKLDLLTETLPQKIQNRALSSLREVISLKLNFVNYKRSEAPAQVLGRVLDCFQEALNSLLNSSAWMRVVGFAPGSFEVEMEAEEHPNLFAQTETGRAIKILLELIQSAENPDVLKEKLKTLKPDAAKSFADLAKALSGAVESTEIIWESPSPEDGGKVKVPSTLASSIHDQLTKKPEPKRNVISIRGQLRGLDLKTRRFRVIADDKQEYSGSIQEESIIDSVIQNAQINKLYVVNMEELVYEQLIDPGTKSIYYLIKLDHLPDK
jgi:hypothetical protein